MNLMLAKQGSGTWWFSELRNERSLIYTKDLVIEVPSGMTQTGGSIFHKIQVGEAVNETAITKIQRCCGESLLRKIKH